MVRVLPVRGESLRRSWRECGGGDQDAHNAPPIHFKDLHYAPIEFDGIANASDASELRINVTADRVGVFHFDIFKAQRLRDFRERGLPVYDRAFRGLFQLGRLGVEFILNLADKLFQYVFQRDKPGGAAVLIDDHCHVDASLLEILLNRFDRATFRHEEHFPFDFEQIGGRVDFCALEENIFDMHHANDMVDVGFA